MGNTVCCHNQNSLLTCSQNPNTILNTAGSRKRQDPRATPRPVIHFEMVSSDEASSKWSEYHRRLPSTYTSEGILNESSQSAQSC